MITEPVTRVEGRSWGRATHWYEDASGVKIPGVTTILDKALPKPALIHWAGNTTAAYAVDHWDTLSLETVSDRLKILKTCRYEDRDNAARRGTEVHALAEKLLHDQPVEVPDELAGHVDSYLRFLDEWQPEPVLTEASVYSRPYTYAGTLDLVADLKDGRLLMDIKTGRSGVYGETALQLAAYRYADRVLVDGVAREMEAVDGCAVIWVRGDGYDLIPIDAGPDALTMFRHLAWIARRVELLPSLVGEALQPVGVAQ